MYDIIYINSNVVEWWCIKLVASLELARVSRSLTYYNHFSKYVLVKHISCNKNLSQTFTNSKVIHRNYNNFNNFFISINEKLITYNLFSICLNGSLSTGKKPYITIYFSNFYLDYYYLLKLCIEFFVVFGLV
jgi:hypothetical protein